MILRPFALIGFSFALTLLAINLFDGLAFSFAAAAACILLLCALLKQVKKRGVYAAAMLAVMLACAVFNFQETYVYQPCIALSGENVHVRAQLISNPVYSDGGWNCTLKVNSIDGKEADCKMAVWSQDFFEAEPYDTVEFNAQVKNIESLTENRKNYYKSKNIFLICYGFDESKVIPCEDKPVGYYLLKANAYLTGRIKTLINGDQAALAAGMLTGDKADISYRVERQFSKTGLSHVLAVSGLHMSVLIMSLYKLLMLSFKRFRCGCAAICIAAAIIYAGVTGFSPSALRSCIMLSIMLGGKIFTKRADALNSMGLAAFVIAFANPYSVTDWSFMLSFSATFGIVLLNRHIDNFSKAVCSKIKNTNVSYFLRYLLDAMGVSLAATAFCLPVTVFFVGSVSTVFLPANLMTLYAVPAVLITALLCALPLGAVSKLSAFVCARFCTYVLKVAEGLSQLEYARVSTDSDLVKYSLLAAALVIFIAALFIKNRKKFLKYSAAVVALSLAINIIFGVAMGYKQVSIAVTQNSVIVCKGSTAVVVAFGYYGCHQASNVLYELDIDKVSLILPELETDDNIFGIDSFFEDYEIERLVLTKKHDYRFLAETYEITDNTAWEFSGIMVEFLGDCCRVVSDSGSAFIPITENAPESDADFLVTCRDLPEWVNKYDYIAVLGGKNTDNYSLLKYNGFGRYEIKGG